MTTVQTKKNILFAGVCIPARLALALAAAKLLTDPDRLRVAGLVGLAVGLRFQYIYFAGSSPNGAIFGDPAWWNHLRPVHGGLYMVFGGMALAGSSQAYLALLADALLGAAAYYHHH